MLDGVQITSGFSAKTPEAEGLGGSSAQAKDIAAGTGNEKFGDVWNDIQAKYGEKPKPPREIKKTLGKDDFLRIMVTQMKHQDPTEPFKAEQFAAQLAQFASVEQLQNINQNFGKMATQNQPLERLAMTNLIGKTVTVNRERFPHTQGNNESIGFILPKDAESVQVSVVSDMGEVLVQKNLGPTKAGESKFAWDGIKTNTLPASTGTYQLKVTAVDKQGAQIQTNGESQTRVIGVTFDGTEPHFLVGNIANPDKIPMKSIVRIAEGGVNLSGAPAAAAPNTLAGAVQAYQAAQGQAPQGAPAEAAVPAAPVLQPNQKNFFTFERGKGSENVDPAMLQGPARQALEQYQKEAAEAGFPNGLGADAFDVSGEAAGDAVGGGGAPGAPEVNPGAAISASGNG